MTLIEKREEQKGVPTSLELGVYALVGHVLVKTVFPGNSSLPLIDAANKDNGQWFTTPTLNKNGETLNTVIGPDGEESSLVIKWDYDGHLELFRKLAEKPDDQLIPISFRRHYPIFKNKPKGAGVALISKRGEQKEFLNKFFGYRAPFIEYYLIMKLPFNNWEDIFVHINPSRLISGMNNVSGGRLHFFLGSNWTKNGIPFDRHLLP